MAPRLPRSLASASRSARALALAPLRTSLWRFSDQMSGGGDDGDGDDVEMASDAFGEFLSSVSDGFSEFGDLGGAPGAAHPGGADAAPPDAEAAPGGALMFPGPARPLSRAEKVERTHDELRSFRCLVATLVIYSEFLNRSNSAFRLERSAFRLPFCLPF